MRWRQLQISKLMRQGWILDVDALVRKRRHNIKLRKNGEEHLARFQTFIEEEYFVVVAEVVGAKVVLEQVLGDRVLALWAVKNHSLAF